MGIDVCPRNPLTSHVPPQLTLLPYELRVGMQVRDTEVFALLSGSRDIRASRERVSFIVPTYEAYLEEKSALA